MSKKSVTEYKVLVGLNYGATRREPGDVCSDIPKQSIGWLLDQGCIVEYNAEAEALMAGIQAQIEAGAEVIEDVAVVDEPIEADEPVQEEPALEAELMPNGNVVYNEVEPAIEEQPVDDPVLEEPAIEEQPVDEPAPEVEEA